MSKLKKIGTILIVGIMLILGSLNTSQAAEPKYNYKVGAKLGISYWDEYMNNPDLYCLEKTQHLKEEAIYEVKSIIDIKGNKSTDHKGKTIESWHNAKFASILSGDNGTDKMKGPVQNAIWNYSSTWMKNVGQYHAGLNVGFASDAQGLHTKLEEEATDYAYSIANKKMEDQTNKGNIKVVPYEKDGKQYMRVGPFKWTFPGELTEIELYANNNEEQSVKGILISSYNGGTEHWHSAAEVKSGKEFYISVPVDSGVTKITKVSGKAQYEVKGVKIWFLQTGRTDYQNLILREPYTGMEEIEANFEYDIPVQGNLKVVKVNEDNKEIKLEGVGFIIQNKNTGKYVHQDEKGNITYVSKEQATEFVTDKNGEISIKNLIVGTYVAYETKNPHYGYEIITEGKEKTIVVNKDNVLTIGNKQKYVKLSGYVWLDKETGKNDDRNDLYKDNEYDIKDMLLDGITVRLKDRTTGEPVRETKTANGGAYLFEDILIEKLGDYYIEFEYDGLTYTNVIPHIDKDNGSKSAENTNVRDEFNKNFSIVEGVGEEDKGITRRGADQEKKHDLLYNIDRTNHKATLINNGQYLITANTDETTYKIIEHFTPGQTEIKYINLGLYEREQPDLAVIKDLENVRVLINGYEHTYLYAQRYNHPDEYGGSGFNVGVKFGQKYGDAKYFRAIYESDYTYENPDDRSKELKVQVTYNIRLRNESTSLISKVNSIVDYYDSRYTLIGVGTELDEKGNVKASGIKYTDDSYNKKYKKTVIECNTELGSQKESSIYAQFELSREAVQTILKDKEPGRDENVDEKELLENVVEINSYTTFDKQQNVYAGVDEDSNPGNAIPGDKTTYQDDTDASPALQLEVAEARELAGKVFVDYSDGNPEKPETVPGPGKIRVGSGAYEDGELGIEGVEITLTENSGTGLVYSDVKTNADGDFLIQGFIPGDYTLTYTWGDTTYTVQNYKGTHYQSGRDQNDKEWYKKDVEKRYTDALDNYNTDQDAPKGSRLQIDEELKSIGKDIDAKITRTKMDSATPTMGIGVEYDNITTASEGDRYTYRIDNVDFGIIERAKQDLALNKRVKTMKVTLPNGQVITDVEIDEDGNITGTQDHLTYKKEPGMQPENGWIKLELDSELLHGSTLEVGYEIKATNNSELDYSDEEFYKYAEGGKNVITITPTAVVDYLDKDWAFDKDKNDKWQVKSLEEIEGLVTETVYNNLKESDDEKIILYTESLKKSLEPTKSADVMLNVSKTLASSDDISLDNETEVVKLDKPGGSKPPSTPGNYVPGTGKTETDDSTAETVIVTPSTGANLAIILPITIGLVALVILGVGVVVIKKKALGNIED